MRRKSIFIGRKWTCVFTSLLIEALYGGAMNLLGEVSPGSIYSYIDSSLGGWEQRTVFKANIKKFVSLRKNTGF